MAYRCLIYDEEQKLDENLRRVLVELAREAATLPAHGEPDAERGASGGAKPDAARL